MAVDEDVRFDGDLFASRSFDGKFAAVDFRGDSLDDHPPVAFKRSAD